MYSLAKVKKRQTQVPASVAPAPSASDDEAVAHALGTVFEKFDELGSARQVFDWWQRQGLKYPVRRLRSRMHPVVWLEPTYGMILRTLHHPIYTGAYVFGRSKTVRRLDPEGAARVQVQRIKRDDWPVLIRDHHPAYLSFERYLANQQRMRGNATMLSAGDGAGQGASHVRQRKQRRCIPFSISTSTTST